MYPYVYDENKYLITGKIKNFKTDYFYCSTSRNYESMCGAGGKNFEKN